MSVKVMGWVWDLDTGSEFTRSHKFVLLAYADHADHHGFNVFPGIKTIQRKTGYSRRSIQNITADLERLGLMIRDGTGPKGTKKFRIPVGEFGGAIFAPPGVQPGAEGGANFAPGGVQKTTKRGAIAIAPESSRTVQKNNRHKTGGRSTRPPRTMRDFFGEHYDEITGRDENDGHPN